MEIWDLPGLPTAVLPVDIARNFRKLSPPLEGITTGDGLHPHASGSTGLNELKTLHAFLFQKIFIIYLSLPGLSCDTWDL